MLHKDNHSLVVGYHLSNYLMFPSFYDKLLAVFLFLSVDRHVYVICRLVLAAFSKLKGRLNSTLMYSALGTLSCFLHLNFDRRLLVCHTVEYTFSNSCHCAFYLNTKYSTLIETLAFYLFSVFDFTFLSNSPEYQALLTVSLISRI